MKELIRIEEAVISNEKVNAVSARELHKVLSSKRKFSDWIKYKLNSTNFREGIDYITLSQTCDIANGASRTVETQYLTLDAAKHIAMLESTDIGHQVRDYFIECEKRLQQVLSHKHMCFLDIMTAEEEVDRALAIRKLDQTVIKPLEHKVEYQAKVIEDKEKVIKTQATEITQAKPKVSYYDIILQSEDLMSITEIAKDYGISAVRLNKILEAESVQYKYYRDWNLYHHYKTQGLTATTTHRVKGGYVKTTLKWNQKGRLFIHDLLKSLNIFATMDEERIAPEPLSHKSFRYIHRNTKMDKPFEKWVEDYRKDLVPRKDYELSAVTLPNSGVTMVDWVLL